VFTRRHLPHWTPEDADVFITWRLAGQLPARAGVLTGDERRSPVPLRHDESFGPVWLQDSRVASVVANALLHGERVRKDYQLKAWVIMPNHVHMIIQPHRELAVIMHWLKGRTARVANRILNRPGMAFWQDECFDHWVRAEEFSYLIDYVENNPVKAGLVRRKDQWPWSSACGTGDRSLSPVNS
jgi:REP element-mobilizing transposase RayT